MSIEQALNRIADGLDNVATAIQEHAKAAPAAKAPTRRRTAKKEEPEKETPPDKSKAEKPTPEAKKSEPKPSNVTPIDEGREVTLEEVRAELINFVSNGVQGSRDKASEILKSFDASKITEVSPDNYHGLYVALKSNFEIDPMKVEDVADGA